MITVGIQDEGFRTTIAKLVNLAKNPANMMDKIARPVMQRDVIRHFKEEMGDTGKWEALKPATLLARRTGEKKRLGTKILQDTGRLRASIGTGMEGARPFVGTNVIYGGTHQFGRGSIPERPFLWLSEDAKSELIVNMMNYIRMEII
jgi:phage gpG-like protein